MGMVFFSKLKKKIADGWLKELVAQIKWMGLFFRRFWVTVVVHILLGVAGIAMGLASSVASKYLIDAVVGHDSGRIGVAAAWMIGMMLGGIVMKAVSSRVNALLNIRVHNDIQAEVYRKILFADWQSLEVFRSGDLLNRLSSDVGTLSSDVMSFHQDSFQNITSIMVTRKRKKLMARNFLRVSDTSESERKRL